MSPRFDPTHLQLSVAYLAAQILVLGILTVWTRSFVGLGFALIAQAVSILPPRLWPYPVLIIAGLLGQSWRLYDDFPNGDWAVIAAFFFNTLLFTSMFVAFALVARQREQMKALVEQVQQAREGAEALAAHNAQLAEERRQTIAALEAARRELAAAERAAGVLEERQRLARDIHDTLAQSFTSIVMHLEAAEPQLERVSDSAHRHVGQARQSARDGLAEARRLVWALRPEALDQASLPEALERLAGRWSEASGVAATTTITGAPRPLPAEVEVTLLRVAQEALANVRKHARATTVTLTLSFMDDALLLDVQDDGVGFVSGVAPGARGEGGFGLTGMRERVARLGGSLSVESAPGEGTTVVVELRAD
ncbi:MAG: sensor histidine kinase [Chloroflexi bacterium]|nr:sensor histidine kinase [Chloroflexota bacterium]